jgi:Ca-activated chloride channel family protein
VSAFLHTLFAHPWLLGTLAVLAVLGVLTWLGRGARRRALAGLGGGLNQAVRRGGRLARLQALCLVLGLLCVCLGAAGPQWGLDWEQAVSPGRDLVVVLDRSRSMLAEKPSRLERARAALLRLADFLKERNSGHRVALVTFAAQPRLVCPLTHDYDHFRAVVSAIDPELVDAELAATAGSASGTRIGRALQLAVTAQGDTGGGARDVLLLSDGDDPARDGEWREGIAAARAAGVAVLVVGLGDPDQSSPVPAPDTGELPPAWLQFEGKAVASRLEEGRLREIAVQTGGSYVPARRQVAPLGPIYLQAIAALPVRPENEDLLPVARQRPLWLLTPAFVLLALSMTLGDGRRARRER